MQFGSGYIKMPNDFNINQNWFSLNGDVLILWDKVPSRIRLSNGSTRTDKSTFTEAELNSAGYKVVPMVNYNYSLETHYERWNGTTIEILEFDLHEDLSIEPDPVE
jgi:hypothetical protein|tara:strand:- start:927 stop:1244 length:318 start_codon:yes stop_codon:yes gene_type:complete